ncbi:MAG: polysaccharide biosynthesis tyrosine autokinase [Coleofasciculaceae cyanobacterium]
MKAEQYPQPLPVNKAVQLNEDDEGGLNLGQVLGSLRRQGLLIVGVTAVVASAAVFKAVTDTPVYQSSFEILAKPETVEAEVTSSVDSSAGSRTMRVATIDETTLEVLRSPRVLNPIVEQLKTQHPDISYFEVNSNLGIEVRNPAAQNASILVISYKHPDQQLVQDILELVSEAYLKYSLEERQVDVRRGIEFVNEQLEPLRTRVESLQEQLQTLRQRYNLLDPEQTGQQLSAQVNNFEQQRMELQMQLGDIQSLYTDLQKESAQQPADSVAALALKDNSSYQSLRSRIQEIDTQIAQKSTIFLDETPEISRLREERQNLLSLLNREGDRVEREMTKNIQQLEVRKTAVNKNIDSLNKQIQQLSVVNREYTDIQRELQIATDNLNQFLTTREGLRIELAQKETPWELLTPPGEPEASSASTTKNLMLGTIVGLLLGVGAALVVDQMRNVLHNSKQLKELTKLPLLGVIPYEKELGEFAPAINPATLLPQASQQLLQEDSSLTQSYTSSSFLEAFRFLSTNIRLLGSDQLICSFVVTSSVPAEGKSTISSHIAQAAAVMGQRVLIVDTDLRRPRVHRRTGVMNVCGLAEVIATDIEVERVIQQSTVEENLFVLTAGQTPPDSIRLLASQKMRDLMHKLQESFDLVIYDAPPLLGFVDASLLAAHTNGLILVAGLGTIKRFQLEQLFDELNVSGTPVLGVVANGAKEEISKTSDYYYYYREGSGEQKSGLGITGKMAKSAPVSNFLKNIKRNN